MELEELRKQIDEIDDGILELFLRRMACAKQVAEVKRQKGLPVFNKAREQEILGDISRRAGGYGGQARILCADLMAMSRGVQYRALQSGATLRRAVREAASRPLQGPRFAACLGQTGSGSHWALSRLFPKAKPVFVPDLPSLFAAVEDGEAELGILPTGNSAGDSVSGVYDLITEHRFFIFSAVNLPGRHAAPPEPESGSVFTRFFAAGPNLFIPPKANRFSLRFAMPDLTGALCTVLTRFAAAGLSLSRIESRPISGHHCGYYLYLDCFGCAADAKTLDLLCALFEELPRFSFLGSYFESAPQRSERRD